MSHPAFETVLAEVEALHAALPEFAAFCAFPDDISRQDMTPYDVPAAALFAAETGLLAKPGLTAALYAAGPHAQWRETYKDTDIGQDFMDRFGCYTVIGTGGPFQSAAIQGWMVYMPAGLHYRWHHHPAEEIYVVLAGEAVFMRMGEENRVLGPGETMFHASNQPHAMETGLHPVLAFVAWRNRFDHAPVLTEPHEMTGTDAHPLLSA